MARDRVTRSSMTCSSWAWAPEASMIARRSSTWASSRAGAEGGVQPSRVGLGGGVQGEGDQHGALALDEVVAGRFARGGRVAVHPEQVVAELERLAERQAVRRQLGQLVVRGAGEERADVEGALDGVLGGLVAQHRHRRLDVRRAAGLHRDVEELAGDHLAARVVEGGQRGHHPVGRQPAAAQQLIGPAQQQVAEQDRRGRAVLLGVTAPAGLAVCGREGTVGGGPSAAGVRGVHVVVVHQRAGVQQLEGGARAQQGVLVGYVGRDRAVSPPAERRAEPLAAGHAAAALVEQQRSVRSERAQALGHLVEEVVEGLLEPLAEARLVPRRHGARLVGRPPP